MRLLAELVALLAPPVCPACREPLARADARLCPACAAAVPWLRGPLCGRCGLPAHGSGGRRCPAAGAPWAAAWAPVAYAGVSRALVRALKLRGALGLTDLLAAQIAANLPPGVRAAVGAGAAVVPVPPHRGRRRARGYDPAGALAAALARRLDRPLTPCLERRDRAPRQAGTSRAARRRPDRMEVRLRAPPPPTVLLVDDVHTTGATLRACAAALAGGGAERIFALAYARAL
jgi:predicted amidophosphoribosyltransferase